LRDGVFDAIRDRVVTGGLVPGERVSVGPLAAELGVSPTPAREALAQLERDGFLVTEPNRGFFVAPLTIEEATGLYDLITLLEAHAVRREGAVATRSVARLRDTNRALEAHRTDPSRAVALDAAWHLALIAGADPLLIETVESLKRRAYRYEHAFMRASGQVVVSTDEHERIAAVLEGGDRVRAAELVEVHWDRSLAFILPWLAEGGAE
jgi:DNA-binding GntR family transcriptional regulator